MFPMVPVTTKTAQGVGWLGEQVGTLALPCRMGRLWLQQPESHRNPPSAF